MQVYIYLFGSYRIYIELSKYHYVLLTLTILYSKCNINLDYVNLRNQYPSPQVMQIVEILYICQSL